MKSMKEGIADMGSLYKNFIQKIDFVARTPNLKFSFIGIIFVIFLSTILLTFKMSGSYYDYSIGDIAAADIKVIKDINYENVAETDKKKKSVEESMLPVYDRDDSVLLDKMKMSGIFFDSIANILRENPPIGTDDLTFQVLALKSRLPRYNSLPNDVIATLFRFGNTDELKKISNKIFIYLYGENERGIIENHPVIKSDNMKVVLRYIKSDSKDEKVTDFSGIINVNEAKNIIPKFVYSSSPNLPKRTQIALSAFLSDQIISNVFVNEVELKRRTNEKLSSVKPSMNILKKGQILVREGDNITPEIFSRIQILNKYAETSHIGFIFGVFAIQIIFLVIFGYFIIESSSDLLFRFSSSAIIFSALIFFMLYTFVISKSDIVSASKLSFALYLPIPFVTMIISIIYNSVLAFFVGVHIVFFTAMISGGDFSVVIVAFSSAMIGVFVNSNVERRTDFLKGGFILGFFNSIVVVAVALMDEMSYMHGIKTIHICFINGIVNSILVMGVLPLYENIFGITTRFRLLELSDLNADIFKKMLVKAPGTYNHSIIVSNMAEAACKDIQAEYLLARVGAYYHDIGKIENSGLYIENKITDPSASKLTPNEYAASIISHVEKGEVLAVKYKIPEAVMDFIREHHGRGLMTFFYHQALEKAASSKKHISVIKEHFQYPGPKPHSRETAVVMLADSIEAASRSLVEPTVLKLESLVKKIIFNKLNEGELDNSGLSMSDLTKIQNSFLRILNGIFHTRIEYPKAEDISRLEKKIRKKK